MVLAWTQDTVGPMCRSAEDCALVLHAIHGPDGRDNCVMDVPFNWDATAGVQELRVGYLRSEFESAVPGGPADTVAFQRATRANNQAALEVIRGLVGSVVPFDLPDVPIPALDFIRYVETAAFFDPVTRGGDRVFQRLVPGAREEKHTTITGAGHFLQEDKGEELAAVVLDFIKRTM